MLHEVGCGNLTQTGQISSLTTKGAENVKKRKKYIIRETKGGQRKKGREGGDDQGQRDMSKDGGKIG